MSEPTEAQKAEAREWAEARCRDLRLSAKFNAEGLARDVLPLIQARDGARAKYKVLCDAVNDGLDCDDKPGNTCSSYGHDEDCPGVETAISLMKYAGDLKAARADADRLAEALAIAHSSIASLEDEALGVGNSTGGSTHWYIRDEVLGRLEAALAAHAAKVIEHEYVECGKGPTCALHKDCCVEGSGRPRSEHRASAGEVVPAPPVFAPAFTEYVRRPATPEAAPSEVSAEALFVSRGMTGVEVARRAQAYGDARDRAARQEERGRIAREVHVTAIHLADKIERGE